MKKKVMLSTALALALALILLGALAAFSPIAHADPGGNSTHYKLNWDVLAYANGRLTSTHYAMDSTVGQTAVIPMRSAHYRLQNGYWGGWWPTIKTYLPNFLRRNH